MKLSLVALLLFVPSAQAQSTLLYEDFESGYANWTMSGLWNDQDAGESCSTGKTPFPSGTHCVWYGNPTACNYEFGPTTPQYLTYTQPIVLPLTSGSIILSFRTWGETENAPFWDLRHAEIRPSPSSSWIELPLSLDSPYWKTETKELTPWAGQTIELRFSFHTTDDKGNIWGGWFIDDIRIVEDPVSTPVHSACAQDPLTWTRPCPCFNYGVQGHGCKSSGFTGGALLTGSGSLRLSADTFHLHMDDMTPGTVIVYQASQISYVDAPLLGGDGRSCVAGSFVRLATRPAIGTVLDFPMPGDATIAMTGFVTAGQTYYYAARYTDAAPGFCSASSFNTTNTIEAYWRP